MPYGLGLEVKTRLLLDHPHLGRDVRSDRGVARKVALGAVVVVLGPAPARDAVLPEPRKPVVVDRDVAVEPVERNRAD